MNKAKIILRKVLMVLGVAALIASLGSSALLYLNKQTLEKQNKLQSDKLTALDKRVDALNKASSDDKAELASLRDQVKLLQPENATLKESVGAFATQAAACDALKHTLNVKG
ncbi:hypothetical protein [Paraburkholderia dioscoreae]|uniref:Uncharacterized protein n=1 Tax=Paraburkholderia dioscoreae TaxID=2604047 RepID=A0A5Q4ZE79_9BURK|nr:hypothetical protein [Paraburkholderia dioscoreae]VVD30963.1 conserved protein of unknown function [Paraburkholderia dioscoreae]